MKQLYMTCMTVLSKHMWKYSSLSIQTSTENQMGSTFPIAALRCSDFQIASSQLPQSGEPHSDSPGLAIIQVSTQFQLQLPHLYPRSIPCFLILREPGWPSENSQSTDTASEIIVNPLSGFLICSGNYEYSSSALETMRIPAQIQNETVPCSTSEIIH